MRLQHSRIENNLLNCPDLSALAAGCVLTVGLYLATVWVLGRFAVEL
jgi:hypothetical protein